MKGLPVRKVAICLAVAVAVCGCGREEELHSANTTTAAVERSLSGDRSVSKPPAVVPKPDDQAQLDRMIVAGYTPHGDHLHPPGVIECPLAGGREGVM